MASPIHRLADETLHEIFTLVAAQWPPRPALNINARDSAIRALYTDPTPEEWELVEFDVTHWERGSLGFVCIGHLCRRFRHILLAATELWATIVGIFPEATDAIVSRAGNRSFTVHLNDASYRVDTHLVREFVQGTAHRVHSLLITDVRSTHARAIPHFIRRCHFPHLVTLRVQAHEWWEGGCNDYQPPQEPPLPLPCLEILYVKNTFFTVQSEKMSAIGFTVDKPASDDTEWFLDPHGLSIMLANSPHLTNLELHTTTWRSPNSQLSPAAPIDLRSLNSVYLRTHSASEMDGDLMSTFPNVVWPQARVHLDMIFTDEDDFVSFQPLFQWLDKTEALGDFDTLRIDTAHGDRLDEMERSQGQVLVVSFLLYERREENTPHPGLDDLMPKIVLRVRTNLGTEDGRMDPDVQNKIITRFCESSFVSQTVRSLEVAEDVEEFRSELGPFQSDVRVSVVPVASHVSAMFSPVVADPAFA
ncbi:hypothetical protein PENSPDRAFT_693589 [Peniophora sp. CONT]|nr:hypothetical protein PENSPDRAFT_693589 [Peniophora sp. CONT]